MGSYVLYLDTILCDCEHINYHSPTSHSRLRSPSRSLALRSMLPVNPNPKMSIYTLRGVSLQLHVPLSPPSASLAPVYFRAVVCQPVLPSSLHITSSTTRLLPHRLSCGFHAKSIRSFYIRLHPSLKYERWAFPHLVALSFRPSSEISLPLDFFHITYCTDAMLKTSVRLISVHIRP